jgi:hypothetical protein
MADEVKVDLQDHSPYRVALELTYRIAQNETPTKDRAYFLSLYAQCRKVVVDGWKAKDAMAES